MHKVFSLLDLTQSELKAVKSAVDSEDEEQALLLLKVYYQTRQGYQGFLFSDNQSVAQVVTDFQQISQAEKKHIFKVADEVGQKLFLFKEPWDMERTQKPYQFLSDIDWEFNPDHDPEWTFMLNRQNYVNSLAQAYLLTNDSHYTEIFMALIKDWLSKNPTPEGHKMTSWRSIDAAIRLRNWVKALEIFLLDEIFSAELLADLLVCVNTHLLYLQAGWTVNRLQTNWVVLEGNGAYLAVLFFPELKITNEVEAKILPYLTQAALTQETSEGLHWEQSYQYHNEVLLKLAEVYLLGTRNQRQLPQDLKAVIERMAICAAHFRKPDGTQDNYGDSDREYLDEFLLLLEQITGLSLLDENQQVLPSRFVLSHFGKVCQRTASKENRYQQSHAFDEAGVYLLKDSTYGVHGQFKCGFLGHGHGHDDLLHLSVFADGEDILVDSGRYSYEETYHHRLAFKSPAYHNTTVVDGKFINEHKNCWDAQKVAHQINSKAKLSEKIDFVEGGHLGYFDLEQPLYTNRKVIFLKPDILVIVDEFLGKGEHEYTQHYHFKLQNLLRGSNENQLKYTNSEGKAYFIENFPSENLKEGAWRLSEQFVSDDYNEKHLAPHGMYTVTGMAPASIVTFISLSGEPAIIQPVKVFNEYECERDPSIVSAFKINEDRYLVVNHYEDADSRRAYLVDGHQVYGRVAMIEIKNKAAKVTRIY